jgi:transglutaminase-like putative cysteine protease
MKLCFKFKKAKYFYFLLFAILVPLTTTKVKAQEKQFLIDYDLDYQIGEEGNTSVTQKAVITNLQNDVIPTTYTFSANQLKISNVNAVTNGEEANVNIEGKGNENLISVVIENYSIGEGRQNTISLRYDTNDIASKSGKIWNIYVPRIQIPETTTLYNVKLSVPKSFGEKIYLSPTPVIEKDEEDTKVYYFTKETFNTTGIIAAFGEYQPINFKLKYQIKNKSILPSIKEIAFPPDISEYQNVSYTEINPKPKKVKTDEDGNIIATYILGPLKEMEIELTGSARLYGKQINPDFGRDFSGLPEELVKKYTGPQKFWEVNSPAIQEVANEIKNNELNVTKNAQKVYNFIVNNIAYDFDAVEKGLTERKGAEKTLIEEGEWTCMEFSDLFISLTRAMGIPAREVNGYALNFDDNNNPVSINLESGDFLHSWAEFYDPFYGWVQVDPTWGTTSGIDYFTKLDTNHLAFVVKGLDSEYPYPAGTYRFSEKEKLIDVALAQSTPDENFIPRMEFQKVLNLNPIQALRGNIKIKARNNGNVSAYEVEGNTVPPKGSLILFVSKSLNEIRYEDMNGNEFTETITN